MKRWLQIALFIILISFLAACNSEAAGNESNEDGKP